MKKPNCYECEYRQDLNYDCHSRCNHPEVQELFKSKKFILEMLSLYSSNNKSNKLLNVVKKLQIKGNLHGIKNGWFFWPINFDPVWLENCNGFKKRR